MFVFFVASSLVLRKYSEIGPKKLLGAVFAANGGSLKAILGSVGGLALDKKLVSRSKDKNHEM